MQLVLVDLAVTPVRVVQVVAMAKLEPVEVLVLTDAQALRVRLEETAEQAQLVYIANT